MDPIPTYPVRVDPVTCEVKVKISPNKMLHEFHGVTKPLCKADEGNNEVVVIVGSGKI